MCLKPCLLQRSRSIREATRRYLRNVPVQPACHPPSGRHTGYSAPRAIPDHSGVASVALLALLPPPPERGVLPKESGNLGFGLGTARSRCLRTSAPCGAWLSRSVLYQPRLYLAAQGQQHVVLVAACRGHHHRHDAADRATSGRSAVNQRLTYGAGGRLRYVARLGVVVAIAVCSV